MFRLSLGAALLFTLLAGCGGQVAPGAEVHDLRLRVKGSNFPSLTGYLVNPTDREISSADVFVTLYDDDRPLEDVQVLVQNIPAQDSIRFEKDLDVRATRARLKLLTTN